MGPEQYAALRWVATREGQPTLDRQVWIDLETAGLIIIGRRGSVVLTQAGQAALEQE